MQFTTSPARLAVAVLALVVLAGCSGSEADGSDAGGSDDASAPTASEEPSQTPAAGSAQTAEPAELTVAASREAGINASADSALPVRADLSPLRRDGELVVLNVTLTNLGQDDWQISSDLDDGTTNGLQGSAQEQDPARYSVDGITLIDGANAKRHLVARDERGHCVCSTALSGVFLAPEGAVVLSATYAAPPDDVAAMDVEVPLFGTFTGVPVQP